MLNLDEIVKRLNSLNEIRTGLRALEKMSDELGLDSPLCAINFSDLVKCVNDSISEFREDNYDHKRDEVPGDYDRTDDSVNAVGSKAHAQYMEGVLQLRAPDEPNDLRAVDFESVPCGQAPTTDTITNALTDALAREEPS